MRRRSLAVQDGPPLKVLGRSPEEFTLSPDHRREIARERAALDELLDRPSAAAPDFLRHLDAGIDAGFRPRRAGPD